MLLDYYLHPEKVPIFGRQKELTDRTVLVPLAFGRNNWEDEILCYLLRSLFKEEEPQPRTDLEKFRALEKESFEPGEVNEKLAERCHYLANRKSRVYTHVPPLQVIGQWEVMYSLYRRAPEWYTQYESCFRTIWPPFSGYLSTRRVLKEVSKFTRGPIAIAAQGIQLERGLRIADKIFRSEHVSAAPIPTESVSFYDERSVQPWTRNQKAFLKRERKVRIFETLPEFAQNGLRQAMNLLD